MKIDLSKVCLFTSILALSPGAALAQDAAAKEWDVDVNEVHGLILLSEDVHNDVRFRWDLSTRSVHSAGVDRTGMLTAFGADIYKVFSSSTGDIGTLRLQGYALRADGLPMTPPFFDSAHDWEWTYRIFDFNYTRFASSGVNLRIGHFEVPFGLEQTQATNGTLRQYLSQTNLGVKADWGVSLNGQSATHEYEVGLTRGSGNRYEDLEENYVFAGRVGTSREDNLSFGASFMSARLPAGGLAHRERLGMDVVWSGPLATVLGELDVGSDEDVDITNALLEVNISSPDEHRLAYTQLLGTDADGDDKYWANLGALYNFGDDFTLSGQWQVDLDAKEGRERGEGFMLQLRCRF